MAVGQTDLQNVASIGIGTSSDEVSRLAVSAQATLLTHDGNGHQLKINKATSTDTASLLFQTGWGGRAEMGTAGSDNYEIKVSADGSTFFTGMQVTGADGSVVFPNGARGVLPQTAHAQDYITRAEFAVADGTEVRNDNGGLGGGNQSAIGHGMGYENNARPAGELGIYRVLSGDCGIARCGNSGPALYLSFDLLFASRKRGRELERLL